MVVCESEGELEGGEGSGVRAKRCLAFVSTIDFSSGNVTEREARRVQDSYQGLALKVRGWQMDKK